MYKKLLFSLVLMAIGFTSSFAQLELTVYDGDATNAYVPVYGFYADAYTKVEIIMSGDELSPMTGGQITGMKWYLASPAEAVWGGRFQIFVKEVTESAIYDYMGMDGATIVYDGPLDGTNPELAIDFAVPFEYFGGNLLVGIYGVETGTYKSATFMGTEVAGASVQGYSYSSLDACNLNQRDFAPKTTFTFMPGSGTVYFKPSNLQASDITTNSATITWTPGGEETAWNVEYKKHADEEWTALGEVNVPTIALDVLENGTPYDVRVQGNYGDGLSGWANLSFNTLVCEPENMGEITYVLTDSYGDGWNNCKLRIYYHNTGILIDELTLASGYSEEGTVSLCYGEDYDLVWVAGSYPTETGVEIVDEAGNVIYAHVAGTTPEAGVLTTFKITPVTCPRPTNLEASDIVYNGATLTWTPGTEEQDLWQVVYGTGEFNPDDAQPINVNGNPTVQLTGLAENTTYTAYVRSICTEEDMSIWSKPCTFSTPLQFALPTDLTIGKITAKSAEATWNGEAETYNLRYRMKLGLNESFESEEAPDGWTINDWMVMPINDYNMGGTPLFAFDGTSCMASQSMDDSGSALMPLGVDNWLISPKVALGGTLQFYTCDLGADYVENYSVYVSTTGTNVEDFVLLGENVQTNGALNVWEKKEFDLATVEGQYGYIAIRHHDAEGYYLFVDAVSIDGVEIENNDWVVVEGTTSPVTMEPLVPGTSYEVEVQGVYADGNSAWVGTQFTTLPADAIPSDLEVVTVGETTAQVTWEGSQDNYNLRYRTAAVYYGITEDFTGYETGEQPEGWTFIDADGDGQNWYVWNLTLEDGTTQTTLSSNSYINNFGPLYPDNWAITPQVKLGASVMFDAWGQDPSYAGEHFQVYVSTTGTEIDDFTPISEEIVATGTPTNYIFDLAEYAGQTGYIAIRHFNVTDMYVLNITNFYMAGESDDVPAGEWVVVENVTAPYTIEGLDPATTYEVEVQGIVEDGVTTAWTAPVNFTTLEAGSEPTERCLAPNSGYEISGYEEATVTITNREEGATVNYQVYLDGELVDEGSFTGESYSFVVTGAGDYVIHAIATLPGKLDSADGGVFFTIYENETPVGISELVNGKQIAGVRYFNALGQEMQEVNGMTIIVTTYTDGTTSTVKVVK